MTNSQKLSTPPTHNNNEETQRALDEALAGLEGTASAPPPPNARRIYEVTDFAYDTIQDKYWSKVDLRMRSADSIDALVPMHLWKEGYDANNKHRLLRPSVFLRRLENDAVVEGSTWWPGQPRIIFDVIVTEEGVIEEPGARCFNTYREPRASLDGEAKRGEKWSDFLAELFGADAAAYLVQYFAHLVQRPHEKCNAIVALTGDQGIGKDTALEAIRNIVGPWNCKEISPDMVFESFDPWKQSLLLVINEARPQNTEHMQWQFYEKLKVLGAAPPHWLHVNAKFEKLRYIRNTMRTVITFNKLESLYVPEDDRRIFIARAQKDPGWLTVKRRDAIHELVSKGAHHITAYLRAQDLSTFDPFSAPPRLEGWEAVSAAWSQREGDVLYEALNDLKFPEAVFSKELSHTNIGGGLDTRNELEKRVRSPRFIGEMETFGYRIVVKPREGDRRFSEWSYGKNGSTTFFRSRAAFLRRDVYSFEQGENIARLDAHGREMVKPKTGEEL